MKTISKLILLSMILVAIFSACKKNDQSKTHENSKVDISLLESKVKYCTQRVHNTLKTNDSIPVDSLKFYLEAASNYTYGIASAQGEMQKIDSNFFTVSCKKKKIALTEVEQVYDALIDSIRVSFYRIQERNKNLIVTMIQIGSEETDKINIKVTSVILYGNTPSFGGFDTTDYWEYWNWGGNSGGKCGPYSGQTSLDAAIKIQRAVMLRKGVNAGCYLNPVEIAIEPTQFPNPNSPPSTCYKYYYLFHNITTASCAHSCLWPYEMNWYLLGAEHICYDWDGGSNPGARPDGYSFISLTLWGDLLLYNPSAFVHIGIVKYGIYYPVGMQSDL